MPVNTHPFVTKALVGKGSLVPLALEVAAKALITSICEQLHIQGTGPVCLVEEANPVPTREAGEPPFNVLQKLSVELYTMVQVTCLLGGLYHSSQEGPAWRAHPANKMQLAN